MTTLPKDREELNSLLAADPALKQNMLEMGFIKSAPFRDHNGVFVPQYELTEYGLREMQERDEAMAMFMAEEQSRGKRH